MCRWVFVAFAAMLAIVNSAFAHTRFAADLSVEPYLNHSYGTRGIPLYGAPLSRPQVPSRSIYRPTPPAPVQRDRSCTTVPTVTNAAAQSGAKPARAEPGSPRNFEPADFLALVVVCLLLTFASREAIHRAQGRRTAGWVGLLLAVVWQLL